MGRRSADVPGSDVSLTSSAPGLLSVPQFVTVKRHQSSESFALSPGTITTAGRVTITATYGGVTQRTTVVVAPANSIVPTSLAVSPARAVGGTPASAIITLSGPAPAGGAIVALSTRRRNILTMPSSVTVPEGATAATFAVATEPVHGNARVAEIDATYNGITVTTALVVDPSPRAAAPTRAVALCASVALEPCLTRAAFEAVVSSTTLYEQRFTLYSPELTLFTETAPTIGLTHTTAHEYVWFAGQPLAQINSVTGAIDWYFNDHLGTPILQNDAAARLVWQPDYDVYGHVLEFRRGEAKHQPLRFPGQTADAGTDLSYNIFRWYRPEWGRYTQADPIGIGGGLNLYGYVGGNPLGNIDPLGLVTWTQNAPVYHADEWDVITKKCGSWQAHGCTLLSMDVNCKCKCESGSFKAKINLKMCLNVWVRQDDPAYTVPQIINEEMKHVKYWQVMFKWAIKRGEQLEGQSFTTWWQCDDACKAYKQATYKDFASDWVHENNPHP
jgi:RHS repeat-associated protein